MFVLRLDLFWLEIYIVLLKRMDYVFQFCIYRFEIRSPLLNICVDKSINEKYINGKWSWYMK
jgi:hypothetical protein